MQTEQTTHPETQHEPTIEANAQPAPQASGLKSQVSKPAGLEKGVAH